MGRVEEVVGLVRGKQNLLEMQAVLQTSISTILDYLRRACGYGTISRADIYFAIPRRYRAMFYLYQAYNGTPFYKQLKSLGIRKSFEEMPAPMLPRLEEAEKIVVDTFNTNLTELPWNAWDQNLYKAYLEFSNDNFLRADLYWEIANLEIMFNHFIREVLKKHYGENEKDWWRKGLTKELRAELVSRLEMDDDPAKDALCYMTFIDIKVILDKNWGIFVVNFPKEVKNDKKRFLGLLTKINALRNQVMHPIKRAKHTYADFELVRNISRDVEFGCQKMLEADLPRDSENI